MILTGWGSSKQGVNTKKHNSTNNDPTNNPFEAVYNHATAILLARFGFDGFLDLESMAQAISSRHATLNIGIFFSATCCCRR
jgi:hypothetical protein